MSNSINRPDVLDALLTGKEFLLRLLDDMDIVGPAREKYSWGVELIESFIDDIEELPPAKLKKGKWIKDVERFGDNAYHCNQCGAVLEKDDLEWRNNYYCYHCGADMRGEET